MPLNYEGTVIRPPSEANSLIFQITLGCSDNSCIFCPAYKDKPFRIKPLDVIFKEIDFASNKYPGVRKVFLADGDALIMPQNQLIAVFDRILEKFKEVRRISLYASNKSVAAKSVEELKELKKRKMSVAYIGFETGDSVVYKMISKYGCPEDNVKSVNKFKEASIKSNVTVILGLGGKKHTYAHAVNTAKILNESKPEQIAALTLMVAKNTPLFEMIKKGEFEPLDDFESLEELKIILEHLEDFPCLFFSNHASNYVPIEARLPKDKEKTLKILNDILKRKDKSDLKPDFLRGL
ncbi:MAG: radical SAM protein [Endomicrobia bacterium]|nr:radical SAM protein [Endomicrobiia bacterium]MCL2798850.1 radical SAM protein [Endomicrobiia bacterium]